jgi:predicted phage terminase large subunit-like protein
MASDLLLKKWEQYEHVITNKEIEDKVVEAMAQAVKVGFSEGDTEFSMKAQRTTINHLERIVKEKTNGGNLMMLEDYAQTNKQNYLYLDLYYDVLLSAAVYDLDSFLLYIERDRKQKDRFYEPRKDKLKPVVDTLMDVEYGDVREVFLHTPPRIGKSQLITGYTSWHISKDSEHSNLYVTHKEDLGGAFLEGVMEIICDPTYRHRDVFPDTKIASTNARAHKLNLDRDKKYATLSGKGLESGLNGEYDAYGLLILDDILEGVQDVLSADVLKRKRTIYQNNVLSRAKENCKIINIGTIWATNDIYMQRRETLENNPEFKDRKFEAIVIPALDPITDESNFDYKFGVGYSTKAYRQKRAEFEENDDLAGWWSQYQQQPIDRKGAVFNPEHMNYYSVLPEEKPLKIIAHGDTALGGGDYVSFPIVYVYENGDWYMEDVVFDNSEKHVTQPQIVSKIKKHEIKNVHFESNQGGEGYKDDIVRMLKEDKTFKRRVNVTSDWAPSTKRKAQRIWDCAEQIRHIYFKDPQHRTEQYRKFMNNLFSFTMNMTKRQHDDAPDSLAGLIEFEENGSGVTTAVITGSLL